MENQRIFVHSGMAHMDEVWAVAFLWLFVPRLRGILPQRVAKLPEDYDPSQDYSLDVGGVFSPVHKAFDHHQLGAEDGQCAASLLVRECNREFYDFLERDPFPGTPSWFKTMRLVDSKGPFAFKKEFGVLPGDAFAPFVTDGFSNPSTMAVTLEFMFQIVNFWFAKFEVDKEIRTKAAEVEHYWIGSEAVVCKEKDSRVLAAFEDVHGYSLQDPPIRISYDDRGEGWTLLRRGDHPRVNFRNCEGRGATDIEFIHVNGFILKTKTRVSKERLTELVNQAFGID